jgi:protein-S-isoprenylcysteine O-methyltransferase Ste14
VTLGPEAPFKLAFIALFVSVAVIASRTARRAARGRGEPINQLVHEAPGLIAIRSGLGIIFYTMLLIWLLRSRVPVWTRLPIPAGARWIAVGLIPFGVALFAWSFASIGDQYRGGVGVRGDHRLVTTGAYRFVRHPIYLSFILLMLLGTCISANWIIGASGVALVSIIAIVRIPIEERELAERFPATWPAYRSGTGCLLPHLRAWTR